MVISDQMRTQAPLYWQCGRPASYFPEGFSGGADRRIIAMPPVTRRTMSYTVSHFEIRARDQKIMEKFYTEVMGFIVSDRGLLTAGPAAGRELIFLSHSPEEHHQIVLIPSDAKENSGSGIGHVAFRVDSLDEVRRVYEKVRVLPHAKPEPVSHGNTWSVYFRDPEDNRIEVFTQTPWHTTQPCRFDVDYDKPDAALKEATRADASKLAGFTPTEDWQEEFNRRFADAPAK
jgi:catechol 2,3-dioxygenase-like lactoylglutathione lyase family enzyme